MIRSITLSLALLMLTFNVNAQKKREIIPRDSITGKYAYTHVSDTLPLSKDKLNERLQIWLKQNYDTAASKYATLSHIGDTYTIHDREALPGKARKFVEYNLTVDLKDKRYRYKLTDLEYVAVGKYPLEDKMATDKREDFEEMHTILSGILQSLNAAMTQKDDW